MLSGRLVSYLKKRKISQKSHLLSLVVIPCHSLCHSLSFVVTRCTTHCTTRYHLLSLVVNCCHLFYHSLSLDVPLPVFLYHLLSLVAARCTTRLSLYKRFKYYKIFSVHDHFAETRRHRAKIVSMDLCNFVT